MRRNYFCVIKLRNPSLHVCISSWALLKQKGACIKVHMATRWTIRHCLMLLWFKDLMNVTKEVTIHRPSVSTLLSSAFIRGDPNAATRGPFKRSLISCLFLKLISDRMKGPLVAAFRSPLMRALDRSVETLCLCTVTSLVTFIKSLNQSSITLCQKRGFFSQAQPKFILQIMSIYISCRSIFQIMSILWYILYFFSCRIRNFQVGTAEK